MLTGEIGIFFAGAQLKCLDLAGADTSNGTRITGGRPGPGLGPNRAKAQGGRVGAEGGGRTGEFCLFCFCGGA